MNKILETIYYDYTEKPLSDNLLETPEISKAFNSFFNAYFGRFSCDECDKACCRLLNIISAYQKKAFETGFYAGMELMQNNLK